MRIPTRGGFAALAVCAAAAVAASQAAVAAAATQQGPAPGRGADRQNGVPDIAHPAPPARVPVVVPPQHAQTTLPIDTPTFAGSLPAAPVASPAPPRITGGGMPEPLIPALLASGEGTSGTLKAPVPDVGSGTSLGTAYLAVPNTPLKATGPQAALGLPVKAPRADHAGLPRPALPEAGLGAPSLQGTPGADLGAVTKDQQSPLPLQHVLGTALGLLRSG